MKHFLTIVFALAVYANLSAQKNYITVLSSDDNSVCLSINTPEPVLEPVVVDGKRAFVITAVNGTGILNSGSPDLCRFAASVIIPDKGGVVCKVTGSDYYEISGMEIAPSKGSITRDVDPDDVPFTYGPVYQQNEFWPLETVNAGDPYILRDYRAVTVYFNPFRYNPVTGVLRVYSGITVMLSFTAGNSLNEFSRTRNTKTVPGDFARIYESRFLNYRQQKYTPVEEDGNMLIICNGSFMNAMQSFVQWKKQKGIPTEIVDVSTIGSAAQIKSYVANYYNTIGLTYLLLVGDAPQVPSSTTTAGDSDNDYGYISGSDHYPEIFVGRFSAENVSHVSTMVTRSVEYEKTPDIAGSWYKKTIGIASDQGPGDDNEMDYEHIRVMQNKLTSYTYDQFSEYFDGDQGGADATGNPTPSMVQSTIDPGAGVIVYTGHGWDQGWGSSGFSNTEADMLVNQNKLPFIWSVACVNGNFVNGTCFAEAWLRSVHIEEPTGAIAVLMSTINQYWSEPMAGQDEMVDLLVESLGSNVKHSFGGISMNGCMKMNDDYPGSGADMTDTWTVFGDPSIVLRTDIPQSMVVSHVPTLIVGSDNTDVDCNIENALVCLTIDGEILGRGYISGGTVNITFPQLANPDTIIVTVTAYNKIPYIGEIFVIPPPTGPYVIKDAISVNDAAGNNNGQAEYSEDILLNVSLKNVGVADASGVSATISSVCGWITLTSVSHSWGNIIAGNSVMENNAFAFTVDDSIPDMSTASFSLNITDGSGGSWTSNFPLTLKAPLLDAISYSINDATGGNGNGIMEPGETVIVNVNVKNNGHATSPAAIGNLSCTFPGVNITSANVNIGAINAGQTLQASFSIDISGSVPYGTVTDLVFICTATPYAVNRNFTAIIGQYSENWESGGFAQFNWTSGGAGPWIMESLNAWEGNFCARSAAITHTDTTKLSISMDVLTNDSISFMRKVSSELYWDFLAFYIDGVQKEAWSGEEDWARVSYPVTTGHHTFSWWFYKDWVDYDPIGLDCGLVDYIFFPPATNLITEKSDEAVISDASILNCWPNPSEGEFSIGYSIKYSDPVTIEISDVAGRIIKTYSGQPAETRIIVKGIEPGLFFVKVYNRDRIMVSTVVVNQ